MAIVREGKGGRNRMKFQRHVVHREQEKYHIFDPLVSSPLKKGERLTIRLV